MEPTPIRRLSSGGLSVPPAGVEEESPRRRLFASAAKDIKNRGGTSHQQQQNLSLASTPPALASLLTPLPGGSPQALCCVGVSPRALFGGGRSVNAEAFTSKRELLPPFSMTPAVEPDEADEADVVANVDGGRAKNKMGGLVAATHAVSCFFFLCLRVVLLEAQRPSAGERDRGAGSAREREGGRRWVASRSSSRFFLGGNEKSAKASSTWAVVAPGKRNASLFARNARSPSPFGSFFLPRLLLVYRRKEEKLSIARAPERGKGRFIRRKFDFFFFF
jgi:hypothetical protein